MRLRKLWITILFICCSLFIFAGCKENRAPERISLKGYSADSPLSVGIGKFSYSGKTVLVTYDNGETEEIPLTEDMIAETDKLKFYQFGKNEITITYKQITTSIQIDVFRNQFSDNVQLKDFAELNTGKPFTAEYTGKPFIVEVEGDFPGNTKIIYPQGNSFQDAGSYDMSAILQCDGYETKILSTRVVIEKATYDVTNAQLYNETVEYNKDAHKVEVKGKTIESNGGISHSPSALPKGVSVSYSITKIKGGNGNAITPDKQQVVAGNSATNAGVYQVCAHFKGDTSNYNPIPDSVATLTIKQASYDLSKVEFLDETFTYSGKAHGLSIAENSKLPLDVAVSYQIMQLKNGAGEDVTDVYKDGNTAINAGEYEVVAMFSVNGKNAENYTTSPLYKKAKLTIRRASYDEEMQDIGLDTQWFAFEPSKRYEIFFDYELPQGVSPQFTLTDENGETIEGEMQKIKTSVGNVEAVSYKYSFTVEKAGTYTCVVGFTHNNEHYEKIAVSVTTWVIISNNV